MKMIEVCCAIIIKDAKILAMRRSCGLHLAGFWEFPGGKIEAGETAEACIIREIKEELNAEISIIQRLQPVEYLYPEKWIKLIPFLCKMPNEEITLTKHSEFRWMAENEVFSINWAAADLKILTKKSNYFKIIFSSLEG